MRPDQIVDRYLQAVTERSPAALAALVHPDYTFREWPNAINPRGSERGPREPRRAGLEHAQDAARAEHAFDVHEHLVAGDTVVSRMTWRGTLAASGQELTAARLPAHDAQGRPRSGARESFDCYEPFTTPGEGPAGSPRWRTRRRQRQSSRPWPPPYAPRDRGRVRPRRRRRAGDAAPLDFARRCSRRKSRSRPTAGTASSSSRTGWPRRRSSARASTSRAASRTSGRRA